MTGRQGEDTVSIIQNLKGGVCERENENTLPVVPHAFGDTRTLLDWWSAFEMCVTCARLPLDLGPGVGDGCVQTPPIHPRLRVQRTRVRSESRAASALIELKAG